MGFSADGRDVSRCSIGNRGSMGSRDWSTYLIVKAAMDGMPSVCLLDGNSNQKNP